MSRGVTGPVETGVVVGDAEGEGNTVGAGAEVTGVEGPLEASGEESDPDPPVLVSVPVSVP